MSLGLLAELAAGSNLGASVFVTTWSAGYDEAPAQSASFFLLGSELAWYPYGGLQSFRVGVFAAYVLAPSDAPHFGGVEDPGLPSFGAFAGYKLILQSGFTVLADAGIGFVASSEGTVFPMLQVGLGWSI